VSRTSTNPKRETLNLRVDPALKADFMAASEEEKKPVAEVLRELMRGYITRAKQRKFVAEARRQSRIIAASKDDADVLRWIERETDTEGWK